MAWFDEFFDEHYLDYWAQMLDEERNSRETRFVLDKLALPAGAKVLDLCCGHARHAVRLAQAGHDVTGLDLNALSLEAARQAAAAANVSLRLVQADMREIPFDGEFDAVINLFTAFGYFETDEDNQRVLQSVARCLKPGGRFLLDHTHLLHAMRVFQPRVWRSYPDGTMLIEEHVFDAESVRFKTRAIFVKPDGSRTERTNDIRCYTCAELSRMLEFAGLTVREVWGEFDGGPLTMDSRRLILLAEKT